MITNKSLFLDFLDRMAASGYRPTKRALIIGIDKYCDPPPPLTTCVKDARDLHEALLSVKCNVRDKFRVSSVYNCKHAEFKEELDKFVKTITNGDMILFYFAGHGEQYNGDNYLIPSDYNYDHNSVSEADYRMANAINSQYIMHRINSARPQITIFILDCCRTKRTRAIIGNGLAPMNPLPETLVVYSCGPGEGALDDALANGNGVFAGNLINHIKTSTKEDIETIFMNVARDVRAQTSGFQKPYRTTGLTEKVYLFKQTSQGKIS